MRSAFSSCNRWVLALTTLALALALPTAARGQSAQNVLVVVNRNSGVSQEIGAYYAQKRKIPARQVLRLSLPADEEIQRSVYVSQIERPIAQWLSEENAQDRILYIVLTKGVPLRIAGSTGDNATVSSVDSELTLLYRKAAGGFISPSGAIRNPYYLGDQPIASVKPFSHRDHDIYLVARLDGYTVADVKALIDR